MQNNGVFHRGFALENQEKAPILSKDEKEKLALIKAFALENQEKPPILSKDEKEKLELINAWVERNRKAKEELPEKLKKDQSIFYY